MPRGGSKKSNTASLPSISWSRNNHELSYLFLGEVEKDENRKAFLGRRKGEVQIELIYDDV